MNSVKYWQIESCDDSFDRDMDFFLSETVNKDELINKLFILNTKPDAIIVLSRSLSQKQ